MVPHYQDAIDMDEVVLRHGHNEKIRRLAQEIAVMRLAVGEQRLSSPRWPASDAASDPMHSIRQTFSHTGAAGEIPTAGYSVANHVWEMGALHERLMKAPFAPYAGNTWKWVFNLWGRRRRAFVIHNSQTL